MGIPSLGLSSETAAFSMCVCVSMQRCTNVCVLGINPIMQTVFFPLSLSLVLLMNNDLIVDCGVKCQLSVCLYVTCHFDMSVFPPFCSLLFL